MAKPMIKRAVKFNPFSVVTVLLCLLCFGSSATTLYAEAPLSDAAFIVACLSWLCLPLAIYQELFFYRYHYLSDYFQSPKGGIDP